MSTRISDMAPLGSLPASGAVVPVVKDGESANYKYDLAADLAGRPTSAQLAANSGSSLIGWLRSAVGAVSRTLSQMLSASAMSPEEFGAAGDGVTDDYAALTKLFAAASSSRGANIRFGAGKTYYIGQYRTATNGVTQLTITGATGLTLDGNGATLSFNGSFDRNVSTTTGIGVILISCAKSKVSNLTLNGNVQNTTNSSGSVESSYSYGLYVAGCTDCTFENIETHHFATDGLAVGPAPGTPAIGSKRISVVNVNSHHNARCALPVFLAEQVTYRNCRATYSGVTGGSYGGHAPQCGTDIEPDQGLYYGTGDINCSNITFDNCYWTNNNGGDIVAVLGHIVSNVSFVRCQVLTATTTTTSAINIGVPGVVFRDCVLNLAGQRLEMPDGDSTGLTTHLFDNCDISGTAANGSTIYSAFTTLKTEFRNCRITCTATGAKGANNFMSVNNASFVMEDCRVFVPAAFWKDEGSGACKAADELMLRASRNRYVTDLNTAGHYFYTSWNTTPVFDEVYAGKIPGSADTFRPANGSTFDTTKRYSSQGFLSASATLGIGYAPGAAWSPVVQATSKSTGVSANGMCGQITMNNAALAASAIVSFTLTNTAIQPDDDLIVRVKSGNATPGTYRAWAEGNASGSRTINVQNVSAGSLSEALVLGVTIIKSSSAAA